MINLRNKYIELLYDYCNTYDSEAISQVLLASNAQKIEMSSIYTDMKVIPRKEYELRTGLLTENVEKSGKLGLDFDQMIIDIDRKIYQLDIEQLKEDKNCSLEEKIEYVSVSSIEKASRSEYPALISEELLLMECKIEEGELIISKRMFVHADKNYVSGLVGQGWCEIKGHYVTYGDFTYFMIEPHWKRNNNDAYVNSKPWIKDSVYDVHEQEDVDRTKQNDRKLVSVNGEVILSEPGGGKTTYLKKRVLEYCEEIQNEREIFSENILFPILITTREIEREDMYDETDNTLAAIIIYAIDSVFRRSKDYTGNEAIELYNYLAANYTNVALVIDGFEELIRDEYINEGEVVVRDDGIVMLSRLINTYKETELNIEYLIISSRYKEYGYQRLQKFVNDYGLQEKFICELKYDEERILNFTEKWFEVFAKINPTFVPSEQKERFKKIYQENASIKTIINTPIELTSLIMLYITSYTLPTDISILYRNVIEVWLTFNVMVADFAQFSLEDVLMELSRVALFMACSEDEKIRISYTNLEKVIADTKLKFERYYRNNEYCKEPVEKIIHYIVRRNIMEENNGMYQFKHRQYQAYLCAYCIIRNYIVKGEADIIKEKRQLDRMRYFSKHLDSCDDFWDQIIIFSAFMDVDLHDSIIEELLERSQKNPNNNYYVGILIQLVNSQGFWFETSEIELVYDELFKNPGRWALFAGPDKKTEVKRMLDNGRKENNTAFLRKGIERYNELLKLEEKNEVTKNTAEEFRDNFAYYFFYTLWRCRVELDIIPEVFRSLLRDNITTEIMMEIYSKYRTGYDENSANILEVLEAKFIKEKNPEDDNSYLIIAYMLGFKKNMHPLEVAASYFEEENINYVRMATNICYIAAWLIQIERTTKYGYKISDDIINGPIKRCKECILVGMTSDNEKIRSECYSAYRGWSIAEYTLKKKDRIPLEEAWYSKEIFEYYLCMTKEKEYAIKESAGELLDVFEVIASYPLTKAYYGICKNAWGENIIVQLKEILEDSNKLQQVLYAYKLLFFAGVLPEDKLFQEFNKIKTKFSLKIKAENLLAYVMELEGQLIRLGLKKENRKWWHSVNRVLDGKAKNDREKILFLLNHAEKDIQFCLVVYYIVESASQEEQEELFRWFLKGIYEVESDNTFEISECISHKEYNQYQRAYQDIISNSMIEIYKNTSNEEEYFSALYYLIMKDDRLGDKVARATALFLCAQEAIIPYAKIDITQTMSINIERLKALAETSEGKMAGNRLTAIEKINLKDSTETVSLMLQEIESHESYEMRVMLLNAILLRYGAREYKRGQLDGAEKQKNK